jgi:hypothetical protein
MSLLIGLAICLTSGTPSGLCANRPDRTYRPGFSPDLTWPLALAWPGPQPDPGLAWPVRSGFAGPASLAHLPGLVTGPGLA